MKKSENCGIFAIPKGSTIHATDKEYRLAVTVAKRKLISLSRHSINGMDAHDFAVEGIMLCQRWGGNKMIPYRITKLILDELRDETGIRRKNHIRETSFHSDISVKKRSFDFDEFEDMLSALQVPEKLKYIIRLRVYRGMTFSQISNLLDISESGISAYVAYWSKIVCSFLERMGHKDAMLYVRKR
jgi:hypothetical protein